MPTNSQHLEQQIQDLQITQMHHESSIEALEKNAALQNQEIQLLKKQIQILSDYLKNITKDSGIKRPEEEVPPPHY